MPSRHLKIISQKINKTKEEWEFFIRAEYSFYNPEKVKWEYKSMAFNPKLKLHQLNQKNIDIVNENIRNSLRILKHHGAYMPNNATEEDYQAALNVLSTTDTGISIRPKNDPIAAFKPFTL